MCASIADRIVRQSGVPELLDVLAQRLAPTDLQSLLLEVLRRRAAAVTPARLLEQYESNRLVRPSPASPAMLIEFDRLAFSLAAPLFEPLELAPLCPLGTNSAVATIDQNQTAFYLRLLHGLAQIGLPVADLRVALTPLPGGPSREQLEREVCASLARRFGGVRLGFDDDRSSGRGYYAGVCFGIAARDRAGTEYSLVDGGVTDWTQRLLSNRKERLLISGIGSERVCSVFEMK